VQVRLVRQIKDLQAEMLMLEVEMLAAVVVVRVVLVLILQIPPRAVLVEQVLIQT
jgi:hypothetical protein